MTTAGSSAIAAAIAASASTPVADALSSAQIAGLATVFGAVAGVVSAFVVGWLTRRHDRSMKAADRKNQWRRDVYLTTIEQVVQTLASIAGLPDRRPDDPQALSDFQKAIAALSKVWAVADFPGALLTRDAIDQLGEMFLRLQAKAIQIQLSMAAVAHQARRVEFLEEEDKTAERAFNAAERAGEPAGNILKSWVKVENMLNGARAELGRLHGSTLSLRKEFGDSMQVRNGPLQDTIARLVVEIRRELEVASTTEDEMTVFVERQRLTATRARAAADAIFAELMPPTQPGEQQSARPDASGQ